MDSSERFNANGLESQLGKQTIHVYNLAVCITLVFVILVSLFNLTYETSNLNLWTAILTWSLGCLMPNPRIKFNDFMLTSSSIKGNATFENKSVHNEHSNHKVDF